MATTAAVVRAGHPWWQVREHESGCLLMGKPDVDVRQCIFEHFGLLLGAGWLEEAGPVQKDARRAAVARTRHAPSGQVLGEHRFTTGCL